MGFTRPASPLRGRIPAEVAGYQLIERVADGAHGTVFKARAPDGRTVALKVLSNRAAGDAETLERFHREAFAARRLDHPNVVRVLDAGYAPARGGAGGRYFLAMEFVEGTSLSEHFAAGRLAVRDVASIVASAARAVHHAHERGVVHRDLKPENILVTTDGRPKVTDFGVARLGKSSRLTQAGIALGTLEYMSPEQAAGDSRRASPATDIYALGAILYQGATGRVPLKGRSHQDTLHLIANADPPPPSTLRSDLNGRFDAVALKCLAKDPERRYATAADLASDLERWLEENPVRATAPEKDDSMRQKTRGRGT